MATNQQEIVTLFVHGRERTFSHQELITILEEYFVDDTEVAKSPTEGKWFEVNPLGIDQSLFEEERTDKMQERRRKQILEAFDIVKNFPERYGKKFKTKIPKKTWVYMSISDMKNFASKNGDHIANWIEQALEWAQRINNGESWETLCNITDTANWYRLVIWLDGLARIIGNSCNYNDDKPVCYVGENIYGDNEKIYFIVPLIVLYDK